VRGAIAVVALTADTADVSAYASRAAARGAKALLVVNDQAGTFLPEAGPQPGVQAQLPVATVSGQQGSWLVPKAQAGATAVLGGGVNSPYVYDLVDQKSGHIPADLGYAPKKSQLARIDTRYLSDHTQLGGEFRCEFEPYSQGCVGFDQYISFPSTRVEYVSTEPGTSWYQGAVTFDGWDDRGARTTYHSGQHTRQEWFGPVVNPRFGSGFWAPERQTDWFDLNLPSYGDSWPGHTGSRDNGATPSQVIKLYRGGRLLQTSRGWQSLSSHQPLPKQRLQYRVTNDVTLAATHWSGTQRSHTEWTFWSRHADPDLPAAQLPFVSLRYHLPTDLHGRLPAGHRVRISVGAYQVPDAVDAGRIAGGSLQVSYDRGATWTRVPLSGRPGHWTGRLLLPSDPHATVSLRAEAWDTQGNRVRQRVLGALVLH
jgi:hypothetical protein